MKDKQPKEDYLGDVMFQTETPEQRVISLENNAYALDEMPVQRFYTKEELDEMKEHLSILSIDRMEKEAELKKLQAPLKAVIKEKTAEIKIVVDKLKDRYEETIEKVFMFDDQANGKMKIYNSSGECVLVRPLFPKEKQTSIIPMQRAS